MAEVCTTYVDGYDAKGRPNRWHTTCYGTSGDAQPPSPTGGGGGGGAAGGGTESGIAVGPSPQLPESTVTVANPNPPARPAVNPDLGLAWNSGAHSIESLPPGWSGTVEFDVPDVQGVRPGGVAVGFAPVSAVPTVGRSGYGHLRYGLVFTADAVRVVRYGAPVTEFSYSIIFAARGAATTDKVRAMIYDGMIRWVVNGLTLGAAQFTMPENFVLDATLYTAFDAVDNPKFLEGELPDELNSSLAATMAGVTMAADGATEPSLSAALQPLEARLSQAASADLTAELTGLWMDSGRGEGVTGALPAMLMVAADRDDYGAVLGDVGPLECWIGMGEPDPSVRYSVLAPTLQYLAMTATAPPVATIDSSMAALSMMASAQTSYAQIAGEIGPLRFGGYGGEMTPLIDVTEVVLTHQTMGYAGYVAVSFVEHLGGTATAIVQAVTGAEALEQITAQDSASAFFTLLDSMAEQIGAKQRLSATAFRVANSTLVDTGQAWVVETRNNATTRYDQYGFNSFASIGSKHFGARQDGVYLLEGTDDAGVPIASGAALGTHDFGTQALKHLDAVYAGVSSTGLLFIKVGDGASAYTYKARRKDDRMKVQRFDVGRGIRTSYFTFDITSESDAFELDSVTFHVVGTTRRI